MLEVSSVTQSPGTGIISSSVFLHPNRFAGAVLEDELTHGPPASTSRIFQFGFSASRDASSVPPAPP